MNVTKTIDNTKNKKVIKHYVNFWQVNKKKTNDSDSWQKVKCLFRSNLTKMCVNYVNMVPIYCNVVARQGCNATISCSKCRALMVGPPKQKSTPYTNPTSPQSYQHLKIEKLSLKWKLTKPEAERAPKLSPDKFSKWSVDF